MKYKDNFSQQAKEYARFRPRYPQKLYEFILSKVSETNLAWDCATGNGQVAVALAPHFEHIIATDASEAQIKQATPIENIKYTIARADKAPLEDHTVDLITVGQALHWFAVDSFYQEVRRVAKPGAFFICFGYGLLEINPEINQIIQYLYQNILGEAYWDSERKYLDDAFQTIPFPFKEIDAPPNIYMEYQWTLEDLIGYFQTWSAIQKYIRANQNNPIDLIQDELKKSWGDFSITKQVKWKLLLKAAYMD